METGRTRIVVLNWGRLWTEGMAPALGAAGFVLDRDARAFLQDPSEAARRGRGAILLCGEVGLPEGMEEQVAALRRRFPAARVVVLAHRARADMLRRVVTAGADAFILDSLAPASFARQLALVAAGERIAPPEMAAAREDAADGLLKTPHLTPREIDILRQLVTGASNKRMAASFGAAENTVKSQVKRLLKKLGFNNRTQAAVWALVRFGAPAGAPGAAVRLAAAKPQAA